MSDRPEFSTRRLRAIAGGAPVEREEMAELVRLARLGQQLEAAPEVTITSLGMGGAQGEVSHTWQVDTGMHAPGIAPLLGQRVRVVAGAAGSHGPMHGTSRWPAGIASVRPAGGMRRVRDWQ